MKGILGLLKRQRLETGPDNPESVIFTTAFADLGIEDAVLIPWEARANEVGGKDISASKGLQSLKAIWAKDKYMRRLDGESIARLQRFFQFCSVAADRDLILQGEYSNFLVVLLSGSIAVDRAQPWGETLRLVEAQPGDILGEMSLLDGGVRFSSCSTLTECHLAVLDANDMDEMMSTDPVLAASLVALLARRLSLRLRAVSDRLSDGHRQ